MANRQVSVYIEIEIVKEMAQCNYNQFFLLLAGLCGSSQRDGGKGVGWGILRIVI